MRRFRLLKERKTVLVGFVPDAVVDSLGNGVEYRGWGDLDASRQSNANFVGISGDGGGGAGLDGISSGTGTGSDDVEDKDDDGL